MLTILKEVPARLLDVDVTQLQEVLPGPTLIHLPGRHAPPLFISTLLHGNEDTSFLAVQSLLRDYQDRELPRAVSIFIGNIDAARFRLRHIDDQPDYNRIWTEGKSLEHRMMQQVIEEMRNRNVFASIDIHNNTGLNPHYACVNRLDYQFLQLAALFGRTIVYFLKPEGVQSMAFAELCPAVTLECGQPGQSHGVEHAHNYLDACLHLSEIPAHPVATADIDLFHTVAIVKVAEEDSIGFQTDRAEDNDIHFIEDLDHLNFSELSVGTLLGRIKPGSTARLEVSDEQGRDVSERYFNYENNEIRTALPVMPSMLTLDTKIIRQDCLCYLMERMSDLPTTR